MKEKTYNRDQKRKRKNNKIQLRVSDDELDIVNALSIEEDETASQVIRKAIKAYYAAKKNKVSYF